jgi:hypothetical protein
MYEPNSPVSTASSGSPPPEDFALDEVPARAPAAAGGSTKGASAAAPASNKRRGPPSGAHGATARDAKSRRREEPTSRRDPASGRSGQAAWGTENKKEDLVDQGLTDRLKKGACALEVILATADAAFRKLQNLGILLRRTSSRMLPRKAELPVCFFSPSISGETDEAFCTQFLLFCDIKAPFPAVYV